MRNRTRLDRLLKHDTWPVSSFTPFSLPILLRWGRERAAGWVAGRQPRLIHHTGQSRIPGKLQMFFIPLRDEGTCWLKWGGHLQNQSQRRSSRSMSVGTQDRCPLFPPHHWALIPASPSSHPIHPSPYGFYQLLACLSPDPAAQICVSILSQISGAVGFGLEGRTKHRI